MDTPSSEYSSSDFSVAFHYKVRKSNPTRMKSIAKMSSNLRKNKKMQNIFNLSFHVSRTTSSFTT